MILYKGDHCDGMGTLRLHADKYQCDGIESVVISCRVNITTFCLQNTAFCIWGDSFLRCSPANRRFGHPGSREHQYES